MPQVIYTGQGYRAPRTQGRALQALGQFTQQEQARKTVELQQAFKDRDRVAEMLQIDPVYVSSQKAQERIGKILDDTIDKLTDLESKRKDRLSTQDLIKMQRVKGEAMAEMQYISSANDQVQQAAELFQRNPDAYNSELWEDYYSTWINEGVLPEGPPLLPSIQSVDAIFSSNREREPATDVEWRQEGGEKIAYKVPAESETVNDETRMMRAVWAYRNNEVMSPNQAGGLAYHVHGVYDKFDDNTKKQFEQMAQDMGLQSGAEAYVAAKARQNLWRGEQEEPWRVASKARSEEPWMNLKLAGGTLYDKNGNVIFDTQDNIKVIDGTLDRAVVFTRPAGKKNLVDVPSNILELTDGLEVKGSSVDARIHAADNNKTYIKIDKGSLDKVTFTKNLVDAFLIEGEVVEAEGGGYKIKEGVEDDVMIPIETSQIKGLIDAWTGEYFSKQLSLLPPKQEAPVNLLEIE